MSLIFETSNLKCFGYFGRRVKLNAFLKEYNSLFNNKKDENLDVEIFRQKLYTKHLKYNAIYDSLLYCQGENAKKEYFDLFGEEYVSVDQLERIAKKNAFILEKLKILMPVESDRKNESITFTKLVTLVEGSRELPLDRNIKLFEFKEIYDIELKKWQQT